MDCKPPCSPMDIDVHVAGPSSSQFEQLDMRAAFPASSDCYLAKDHLTSTALPLPPNKFEDPAIQLSQEQRDVLDLVKAGKSVFFTGSAGTGKSVLLKEIIKECTAAGRALGVTASKGIAALNIGGVTLHSWAGIGLGKESAPQIVGRLLGTERRYNERCSRMEAEWAQPLKKSGYTPQQIEEIKQMGGGMNLLNPLRKLLGWSIVGGAHKS